MNRFINRMKYFRLTRATKYKNEVCMINLYKIIAPNLIIVKLLLHPEEHIYQGNICK